MRVLCVSAFENRRSTIKAELKRYGHSVSFIPAPRGMEAAALGWLPAPAWRDPYENRLLTWGELACMAGHAMAWEVASKTRTGAVIIEDDVQLKTDFTWFEKRGDLVYLSHKFMQNERQVENGMVRPPYTYWLNAYWISPRGAESLLTVLNKRQTIPADEFVPYHFGKNPHVRAGHGQAPPCMIEAWAVPEDAQPFSPSGRWPSATQWSDPAYELRTAAWATDPSKATMLTDSLDARGWPYEVLMEGRTDWTWDTGGRGGILKLSSLSAWLRNLDQEKVRAVACALDGYDVRALTTPKDVLLRYGQMGSDIVVGAELNCWPDKDLAPKLDSRLPRPGGYPGENKAKAIYRYPNSGTIIGMADKLYAAVDDAYTTEVATAYPVDKPDDQRAIQRQIIKRPQGWRLDREAYLFQTLAGGAERHLEHDHGIVRNRITTCRPAFVHANGYGVKAEEALIRVGPRACPPFAELAPDAGEWHQIGPEIIGMPFLTERSAVRLAEAARLAPDWKPLPGDNVPGDELRLKAYDAGRADQIKGAIDKHLSAAVIEFWKPARWPGVADLFFIRYSPDRQPSIRLHEDNSSISCSIKIRKACNGGVLWFPRQNFSDINIPLGWLIAWPSKITHPHLVKPVLKGTRISIVVWSR